MVFFRDRIFDLFLVKWALNWAMPMLFSAAAVAMTYHLVTLVIDGVAGLTAAIALICTGWLREFSTVVMAPAPMAFLGLMILWLGLTWRNQHRLWRAAGLGACFGWAAITRPVDAIISHSRRSRSSMLCRVLARSPMRAAGSHRCHGTSSARIIPFVSLQAVFDRGTTGKWLVRRPSTPLISSRISWAACSASMRWTPNARPASPLPQKRQYYERVPNAGGAESYAVATLPYELAPPEEPWTFYNTATRRASRDTFARSIAFWSAGSTTMGYVSCVLPLFVLLYLPNPFFLMHYLLHSRLSPHLQCRWQWMSYHSGRRTSTA